MGSKGFLLGSEISGFGRFSLRPLVMTMAWAELRAVWLPIIEGLHYDMIHSLVGLHRRWNTVSFLRNQCLFQQDILPSSSGLIPEAIDDQDLRPMISHAKGTAIEPWTF